jgi:adenylosuccinate synthase
MTEQVYVITDLGPGDGGKGGVVHKTTALCDTHTVVKVGGAQGSHGMCNAAGDKFAFSQFGCGTFEGVRTHISSRFTVSPTGLLREADALRYERGVHDPFSLLTVDGDALCATPFHGNASRLKELARGNNPRGTIGTGVGEAVRDAQRHPELAIYARDLSRPDLRDRLAAVRSQILRDLIPVLHGGGYLREDHELADREAIQLRSDDFLDEVVRRFHEASRLVRVVDHDFLAREILPRDGVVVVEASHGILTDRLHGFHPHTSAIRTLPCFTHAMLREAGYDGQIVNVGVCRAYGIRHGAGPMPTANPVMSEHLLPGSHKDTNRWQGEVRVGPLDLPLLRYAIAACGGPSAFDALAITWFDQILVNGAWHVCHGYNGADDPTYFTPTGELKVRRGEGTEQLAYQEALGRELLRCTPKITTHPIAANMSRDEAYNLCADVLRHELGVPVRMISFGPTEQDKVCG